MRILHVTDSFLPRMGGIERQVDGLSLRQALRGDDVTVACAAAPPAADPSWDPRTIRRPDSWSGTQIAYHRGGQVIANLELDRFDIVHAHVSVFSPLAMRALRAASRHDVPAVATVHSLWTAGEAAGMAVARDAGMFGRHTVAWTAVSTVAADTVARRFGTEVGVLPNGIDSAFWATPRDPRPQQAFRVATVMRLVRRKRAVPLVAMVAALRARLPADRDLRVRIVGAGPQRSAVADAVRRAGLEDCVRLEGRLTSAGIRDVFADSDVYVSPARNESFGIAALEAHCAGLPVVARASSGVADIVTDPQFGRLVADDAAMVRALADLAGDPGIGVPATPARSPFDWPTVLGRTDDVYSRAALRVDRSSRARQPTHS